MVIYDSSDDAYAERSSRRGAPCAVAGLLLVALALAVVWMFWGRG
jgi:hypothetical protein